MNDLIKKWKELREFALFSTILNTSLTCRIAGYFFQPNAFTNTHTLILNILSTVTSLGFTTLSARTVYKNSKKIYYARNPKKLESTLKNSPRGKAKYEFALDVQNEIESHQAPILALQEENTRLKNMLTSRNLKVVSL